MFGVYDLFHAQALRSPDKLALCYCSGTCTYRELDRRVNAVSLGLSEWGVTKGSKVALVLKNGLPYVEAFLALLKLGARIYPFNYRLIRQEIVKLQKQVNCEFYIAEDGYTALLRDLSASEKRHAIRKATVTSAGADACIELFEASGGEDWEFKAEMEPSDVVYAVFTGGTTGLPKAAIHTQESSLAQVTGMLLDTKLAGYDEVFVNYAPLCHIGGLSALFRTLCSGGTFVLLSSFDPDHIIDVVQRFRATQISLIPPSIMSRFRESKAAGAELDLSSVKYIHLAGGASDERVVEEVFDLMPDVVCVNGYGHSETALYFSHKFDREEFLSNRSVVSQLGLPQVMYEAKIVGEDGAEAPLGSSGEVLGRSKAAMLAYEGMPDPFTDDGWLPTGDVMTRDEGGFRFCTRCKDMIKSGGENVFASEVENAILKCNEEVAECAVFPLPDERWGEIVMTAVVLREGSDLTAEGLVERLTGSIAHYKKPKKVVFLDSLPRSEMGKVQKNVLRERAEAGLL